MRTDDQITMTAIKRKMTKTVSMHLSACGHDSLVSKALQSEFELLHFIEDELEKRTKKLEQFRIDTSRG